MGTLYVIEGNRTKWHSAIAFIETDDLTLRQMAAREATTTSI